MAVQGSPLPFAGTPYAENQLLAERAYQQAMANLQTQRNQYMTNMGFNPSTGAMQYNPMSQWGQLSNTLEQAADATDNSLVARGLESGGQTSGLGRQQEEQSNYARDLALTQFGQKYQAGLANYNNKMLNTQQNFNNQTVQNRMALINYLISHGQFTHGAPYRRGKR